MWHKLYWHVVIVSAMILAGCEKHETPQSEEMLRPVKSTIARKVDKLGERLFSGVSQTSRETDLSFKVSGMILSLPIKIGDVVTSDSAIAKLDDETYSLLLAQAKADTAKAYATQNSAQSEYQRNLQLYKKKVVSKSVLEQVEAESNSAKAAYDAAIQAEQLAKLNLNDTQLFVSEECRIADIYVKQNENIASGQAIARASCGNTWEIRINVPEGLISSFTNGMKGTINFPAFPESSFSGVVTEVGVAMNNASSFPVTLELTEPPTNIRTSMAAEVSIILSGSETGRDIVFVPPSAVVSDHNGPYVYLIESSDEAGVSVLKRQSVSAGIIAPAGLAILSGLEDGEEVLLSGHVNVRDGMKVKATSIELTR